MKNRCFLKKSVIILKICYLLIFNCDVAHFLIQKLKIDLISVLYNEELKNKIQLFLKNNNNYYYWIIKNNSIPVTGTKEINKDVFFKRKNQ